jgi:broad specificity phosphatase PhoE
MNMRTLYFVRHGQSEANAARLVAGQLDSPLTPLGHEQAETAADQAKSHGLRFDVIVSSTLSRSVTTARIIADRLNYPYDEIIYTDDLRERHCGDFEGGPIETYYGVSEEEAAASYHVESLEELYVRASKVLTWLNDTYPNQDILIVSHSGIGKMLRIVTENKPVHSLDKTVSLPNAEIIKLA